MLHLKETSSDSGQSIFSETVYRPVHVKGRVLPQALIDARAGTKHPENCMDLKKGGRRALHAILAFYNLKTKAAIFPSRDVLAYEAGVSVPTLYRDLAELEAREYIIRHPQRHKSAAAGTNAGKFWLAPIQLTHKALLLLGLDKVIHKTPSLKTIDGIYIDKEHTKEKTQSSTKNTIPAGNSTTNNREGKNEIDPQTRLPKDLIPLLNLGISRGGIFLLMKLASTRGKRLSDILAYRWNRIVTLKLSANSLFSYLRDLTSADVDFGSLAQQSRVARAENEDIQEAKALQQRLYRYCDGYEIRRNGVPIGIFRASASPEECGYIEMEGGSRPLNLHLALALLRGPFTVESLKSYTFVVS